jgi:hypothetical protein
MHKKQVPMRSQSAKKARFQWSREGFLEESRYGDTTNLAEESPYRDATNTTEESSYGENTNFVEESPYGDTTNE